MDQCRISLKGFSTIENVSGSKLFDI
jgi:hypothetical protein